MITLLLLVFPVLIGLLLLGLKNTSNYNLGLISFVASVAQIIIFAAGFNIFKNNPQNSKLDFNVAWVERLSLNFHLGWDGLTALMLGLTVAVIALIVLSVRTFDYNNKARLYALIFFVEAALIGVFTAKETFVFYFFFEIALIPVYLIANFWGGKNATKITFKLLVYTVFGSLFMLVAFVLLYMRSLSADISILQTTVGLLPQNIQTFVFWAFLLAFAIKMPIFPLHTWLPDAYSESPTPASMLLSGLLSKMGVYGLIRILLPLAPAGTQAFGMIVITLGIIGLIYGSIIAIQQDNIKQLIAYSSFSHMGIMAGAVLTQSQVGLQGAIFQMIAHGFNAVGLFYIAKIISDRTGTRSLSSLGGITQKAPILSVLFMITLLGSVALPLTNGFVGEFLMLKAIFDYNSILGAITGLSVIFGAVYMLRFFQKTMFGEQNKSVANFSDLSNNEMLVLVPIVLVILISGIFPNTILHVSEPFVKALSLISK
jgi:NADH-quinone oxidoreductase subunit M